MKKQLIKNAVVYDAVHWGEKLDILVVDDKIETVAESIQVAEDNTKIIDLGGHSVFPGFIDAHVHCYCDNDPKVSEKALRQWAQAGVTAVRDLGASTQARYFDWLDTVKSPEFAHIFTCGKAVTSRDGTSYRAPQPGEPDVSCDTPAEAGSAVDKLLSLGVDGIKTKYAIVDLFPVPNGPKNLKPEETRVIVKKAAEAGKWVCAHVLESELVPMLLESGMPELAHIPVDELPDETVNKMLEADVMVTPTLTANAFPMPPIKHGMPAGMPPAMPDLPGGKAPDPNSKEQREKNDRHARANIKKFIAGGGFVAVGTDVMRLQDHDEPMALPVMELKLLHEAGLSMQEAIAAGTLNSAIVCKADNFMGSIEPGKQANLIATTSKLDESFDALKHLDFVMNRGCIIRNQMEES